MQRDNRELWLAFITIGLISVGYYAVVRWLGGIPPARELFGHSLGVIGLVLMLMTETLYSLRKRSLSARWGRPASWLKFHIYTGIVGPYLALLHTAWKFNGLAGMVVLMTILVVLSGFIGRYIYTALPRRSTGAVWEEAEINAQIVQLDGELQQQLAGQPEALKALAQQLSRVQPGNGVKRTWDDVQSRKAWQQAKRRLSADHRAQAKQLEATLFQGLRLKRQKASLATSRRLLGLWHSIHVPLGMVLFTAAIIHVTAAIYYATLLH